MKEVCGALTLALLCSCSGGANGTGEKRQPSECVVASAPHLREADKTASSSFGIRTGFVRTPPEVPPILANLEGPPDGLHRLAIGAVRGQTVADVGCGSGYYLFDVASDVGPDGRVFCRDINAKVIARLARRIEERVASNMETAVSRKNDVTLPPASIDVAYLGDVYHIVASQQSDTKEAFLDSLLTSLKPGGVVVVVYIWAVPNFGADNRDELLRSTWSDFVGRGFVAGRSWRLRCRGTSPQVLEFQKPSVAMEAR